MQISICCHSECQDKCKNYVKDQIKTHTNIIQYQIKLCSRSRNINYVDIEERTMYICMCKCIILTYVQNNRTVTCKLKEADRSRIHVFY